MFKTFGAYVLNIRSVSLYDRESFFTCKTVLIFEIKRQKADIPHIHPHVYAQFSTEASFSLILELAENNHKPHFVNK